MVRVNTLVRTVPKFYSLPIQLYMKKKPSAFQQFLSLYISVWLVFWGSPLQALPTNPNLVAGQASFNANATQMIINQASNRAIINWDGFSIGSNELTQFIQSGAGASVLNRVTGGNMSEIFGTLQANGNVYLVNPSGILIGSSGVINVNSFIASTLNVSNSAFMNGGDFIFKGDSNANIKNLGTINAVGGDVFLIAKSIENAGTINAPKGTVGLAAGDEVLLKSSGDQRIFVRVKKKKDVDSSESTDATTDNPDGVVDEGTVVAGDVETVDANAVDVVEEDSTDSNSALSTQNSELEASADNGEEVAVNSTEVSVADFKSNTEEYEYVWEPVSTNSNVGFIKTVSTETETSVDALLANVASDTTVAVEAAQIINTGIITAVQAELKAVGGNMYALAINNEGTIRATGVEDRGGQVYIVADSGKVSHSGTIDASNANGVGGTVHVLGDQVEVSGNINASGLTGGGEILMGGDYQGLNQQIKNATETVIGSLAVIQADALRSGNGGKIIVWSNENAAMYGSLTARGGTESGNGGFIETSGKKYIYIDPTTVPDASARAEGGEGGSWLIDPNNISIVAGSGNTAINTGTPFASTNDSSILGVDLISTALTGGTSVTVTTASAGTNAELGNITWGSGVTLDYDGKGAASLSLVAENDILFDGKIYDTAVGGDSLNVTFDADSNNDNYGSVAINGGTITTNGGNITLQGSEGVKVYGGASLDSGGGNVALLTKNAATATFIGVEVDASTITSGAGTINLTGVGGQSGTGNVGVKIHNGSTLSSAGATNITGTGGIGTGSYGAYIGDATITATTAAVNVTGTSATSHGVKLYTATNTATVTSDTDVTITGKTTAGAGKNDTILSDNSAVTATGSGTVNLLQGAGATGDFLEISASSSGVSSGSGAVTVQSDKVKILAAMNSTGGGALTMRQHSVGTVMNLGVGATDSGFQLDSSELTNLSGYSLMTFGRSDSTGSSNVGAGALVLSGDVTLEAGSGALTATGSIDGTSAGAQNLIINSNSGAVTFSGVMGGTTTLGSVTLAGVGNTTFSGTVDTTGHQTYTSTRWLTVNGGNLTSTAGNITFNGTTEFGANTVIDTSTGNGNITLNNGFDNTMAGGPYDITLNAGTGIVSVGGVVGGTYALGTIDITSGGNVSDSSLAWTATSLKINTTGNIDFGNAAHSIINTALTGANVNLNNGGALIVGGGALGSGITASGTLDLTTTGLLSQAEGITASGMTTINTASANADLSHASNDFSQIAVTALDATINDVNSLDIGASNFSNNLTVTTTGYISYSGAWTVSGNLLLDAQGSNDIIAADIGNAITGSVIMTTASGSAHFNNSIATSLGASTVVGDLNVTSEGAITQVGLLNVGGNATFVAFDPITPMAQDITLTNASNVFGGHVRLDGYNVQISAYGDLLLDHVITDGTLDVTTVFDGVVGSVYQTGAPFAVLGALSITSGDNIFLDGPYNNINDGITEGGAINFSGTTSIIDLVPDPTAPPPGDGPPPEEEPLPPPPEDEVFGDMTVDPTTGEISLDDGNGGTLDYTDVTTQLDPTLAGGDTFGGDPGPAPTGDFGGDPGPGPVGGDGTSGIAPDGEPAPGGDGPLAPEGDTPLGDDGGLAPEGDAALGDEGPVGSDGEGPLGDDGGLAPEGEGSVDGEPGAGPDGEPLSEDGAGGPEGDGPIDGEPGEGGAEGDGNLDGEGGPEGEPGPEGEEGGPADGEPGPEGEEGGPTDGEPGEGDGEGGPADGEPGEGDGEGGPEDGEPKEGDEPPADEEGGEGEPAEGDVEAGPVEPQDGTDTSNDDAVVAPGETVSMNPNAGPPPQSLASSTAPAVRTNLGSNMSVTPTVDNGPPPAPALPANLPTVAPGQTLNLGGGSFAPPPPQIQFKLDAGLSTASRGGMAAAAGL